MDERRDLRLPLLAAVAWGSAVGSYYLGAWWFALAALGFGTGLLRSGLSSTAAAALLISVAAGGGVLLRLHAVDASLGAWLAREAASVNARVVIASDPKPAKSRFEPTVTFRAKVEQISGRGRTGTSAPVRVSAPASLATELRNGQRVDLEGRITPARDRWLSGTISVRGSPVVVAAPSWWVGLADRFRAGVRHASSGLGPGGELVPAMVDGDDRGMSDQTTGSFQATSLTHLLAVSGTNLTLFLAFVLGVARLVGVRALGLLICGACTIAMFLVVARAEPSVARSAAMGVVALAGLSSNGSAKGLRALSACVIGLLLFDPGLSLSPGFTLSAAATGAILLLAPGLRAALGHWTPKWLAEAIAVPLSAELVCAPIVAALSGQVSLVGIAANVLAGPAVGPTTVFGMVAGLADLALPALGRLLAIPAALSAAWIVWVAERGAALTRPVLALPAGALGVAALAMVCLLLATHLAWVLRRPRWTAGLVALVVLFVLLPGRSWLPDRWVLVACDVGQGDGLVLSTGEGEAVVVDAGPESAAMRRCLDDLGIRRVRLLVITHFHADHVDGLPGVLAGRQVDRIEHTPLEDPDHQAAQVRDAVAAKGIPFEVAELGGPRQIGQASLQILAPSGPPPPESGSPPNDSSVVLYVESRGLHLLLMGDEEGPSQALLRKAFPGLTVDVLKVAHHGSAKQDAELVTSLRPTLALISVGARNSYHHPAPSTVHLLEEAGARIARTDVDGALAVGVSPDRGVVLATRRSRP